MRCPVSQSFIEEVLPKFIDFDRGGLSQDMYCYKYIEANSKEYFLNSSGNKLQQAGIRFPNERNFVTINGNDIMIFTYKVYSVMRDHAMYDGPIPDLCPDYKYDRDVILILGYHIDRFGQANDFFDTIQCGREDIKRSFISKYGQLRDFHPENFLLSIFRLYQWYNNDNRDKNLMTDLRQGLADVYQVGDQFPHHVNYVSGEIMSKTDDGVESITLETLMSCLKNKHSS